MKRSGSLSQRFCLTDWARRLELKLRHFLWPTHLPLFAKPVLLRFEQLEDRTAPASYFTWQNPGPLFTQEGNAVSLNLSNYLQYTQSPPEGASPITFTASDLPPGLSLDAHAGLITGSPDYSIANSDQPSVDFTITLTASDTTETASLSFTRTILDTPDQSSQNGSGTGSSIGGSQSGIATASIQETDALLNLLVRWFHASSGTTDSLPSGFDSSLTLSDAALQAYSLLADYPAVTSFVQDYIYSTQASENPDDDELNYIGAPVDIRVDLFDGYPIESEITWQNYLDWLQGIKDRYPGEELGVLFRTDTGDHIYEFDLSQFEDPNLAIDENLLYLAYVVDKATDSRFLFEEAQKLALVEPVSNWTWLQNQNNNQSWYERLKANWETADTLNLLSGIIQVGVGVVLIKTGVGAGVGSYMIYRGVDTAWRAISSERMSLTQTFVHKSTKWVTGSDQAAQSLANLSERALTLADLTIAAYGGYRGASLLFERLVGAANAGQRLAFTIPRSSLALMSDGTLGVSVECVAFISVSKQQAALLGEAAAASAVLGYMVVTDGNRIGVIRVTAAHGPPPSGGPEGRLPNLRRELEANFRGTPGLDRLNNAIASGRPGAAAEGKSALRL